MGEPTHWNQVGVDWVDDAKDRGIRSLVGDLNNDGVADLMWAEPEGDKGLTWSAMVSQETADGVVHKLVSLHGASHDHGNRDHWFRLGDVNDDGSADLLIAKLTPDSPKVRWHVCKIDLEDVNGWMKPSLMNAGELQGASDEAMADLFP